jgi:hypothetical protein
MFYPFSILAVQHKFILYKDNKKHNITRQKRKPPTAGKIVLTAKENHQQPKKTSKGCVDEIIKLVNRVEIVG